MISGEEPACQCRRHETSVQSLSREEFICTYDLMGGSDSKESACSAGDPGSIPRLGLSPGKGNGNPLQYSCQRIQWTEDPGGLQLVGSQRVRHYLWLTLLLSNASEMEMRLSLKWKTSGRIIGHKFIRKVIWEFEHNVWKFPLFLAQ